MHARLKTSLESDHLFHDEISPYAVHPCPPLLRCSSSKSLGLALNEGPACVDEYVTNESVPYRLPD